MAVDLLSFRPDWHKAFVNAEYLKRDLDVEFKGEGWYKHKKQDTVLVVHAPGHVLYAFIWNNSDPRDVFRELIQLPNHE